MLQEKHLTSGLAVNRTTPGFLRLLMAGLLALSALWGTITFVSAWQHSSAAGDIVATSEPLSVNAKEIYHSLSDADATAGSAFLAGGLEPTGSRLRYNADLADAATRIETVSASAGHSKAGPDLATLAKDLPAYAGLIESARANNLQGFPVAPPIFARPPA